MRTSDSLTECLILDRWPTPAAVVDFGLDDPADQVPKYRALQSLVRGGLVTANQLARVAGDGPAITALVRPHAPGLVYVTAWDTLEEATA